MYRIMTVCTGNICRSPMAQFCLARAFDDAGLGSEVTVDSTGVTGWEAGRPMDDRTFAELAGHGFAPQELAPFRARAFTADDFAHRDLILAMDYGHLLELQDRAGSARDRGKVRMIRSFDPASAGLPPEKQGIDDPWYGDMSDFDSSYALIQASVPGVVEYVRAALDAAGSADQ
ncbi:low molecular weight protein-tyrosine-phosphatase [Arthrobacter sp. zg-Y820]|uniref:low molecular weight protein-tyrosine-phosphatase n=1 Tax=unclassified Arthrobacter TaxID=235627 RepID=UPI001E2E3985|nr:MULTISPECIES: low molecular weight protein-tyrosine-phosphatase [unclassified Arthrobacter]MCC9197018.1 low molecular weight phosphotyrosine protein phosphatase [Arthrobacter sp. zg-Y820]MDK1279883.1 low molecular weight protein-tyrosine-phosphatase [Arthrobacter sp. zg.Y820]WIB09188.1 low molecular weight protein-tyrosine-phosphatase [Arthrobacter sp. zg-Y820]